MLICSKLPHLPHHRLAGDLLILNIGVLTFSGGEER